MADIYYFTDDESQINKEDLGGGGGEGPAQLGGGTENDNDSENPTQLQEDREDEYHCDDLTYGESTSDTPQDHVSHTDQSAGDSPSADGDCETDHDGESDNSDMSFVLMGLENDGTDNFGNADYSNFATSPLHALDRLKINANSDNDFDRQMAARSIHECLRLTINDTPKQISTVLRIFDALATSEESTVRIELMEQVPQIAMLFGEYCIVSDSTIVEVIRYILIPVVLKFLTDSHNQVRKTAQAALLVMLEQDLISKPCLIQELCPTIADLTEPVEADEFRTEAIALISKMAPLVGTELTESFFVNKFRRHSMDTLFQVRKACATNFGDITSVVNDDFTKKDLLSKFIRLCEDGVWGVRKACAEVFMSVSCSYPLEFRKDKLSPIFVALLTDQSRWVRVAAFQNLGPFISTFADPRVTGLHYNEEGTLVIGDYPSDNTQLNADNILKHDENRNPSKQTIQTSNTRPEQPLKIATGFEFVDDLIKSKFPLVGTRADNAPTTHTSCTDKDTHKDDYDNPSFNELNYWRMPLMNLEINDLPEMMEKLTPNESATDDCVTHDPDTKSNQDMEEENMDTIQNMVITNQNYKDFDFDRESNECEERNEHERCRVSEVDVDHDIPSEHRERREDVVPDRELPDHMDLENDKNEDNVHKDENSEQKEPTSTSTTSEEINVEDSPTDSSNTEQNEEKESTPLEDSCDPRTAVENLQKLTVDQKLQDDDSQSWPLDSFSTEEKDIKTDNTTQPESETPPSNTLQSPDQDQPNLSYDHNQDDSPTQSRHEYNFFLSVDEDKKDHNSDGILLMGNFCPAWVPLDQTKAEPELIEDFGSLLDQDIVPRTLLEHYIGMTEPSRAETVDNEITRHCAYSLPAVALTLGRKNWPVLKRTYKKLAVNMHWKVRRTLAFSLHELAIILGEDQAYDDLVPIFEGFIKDLDEVRIGVLKHLTQFLGLLSSDRRGRYLPRLCEFLKPDNDNNWRFRLELTSQLLSMIDLFDAADCDVFIRPVALTLLGDKVVHIRRTCYAVISKLAARVYHCHNQTPTSHTSTHANSDTSEPSENYLNSLANDLACDFWRGNWTKRQSYVFVCGRILSDGSVPLDRWCELFLTNLLDLANDRVPNIRIAVAKILKNNLAHIEYFQDVNNNDAIRVANTLQNLTNDRDRDVNHFATYPMEIYSGDSTL